MGACSSIRQMEVNIPKPALFELPADIKRVAIIDRSEGNATTIIEGALTGEMVGIDKILSQECISGLTQMLNLNDKLQVTRHSERLKAPNTTSTGFGANLDWAIVDQIAQQNNADALLVLEYFDSDYNIRDQTKPNNVGTVLVQGYASVTGGFRIYDTKNRTIIYERGLSKSRNFGETAATREMAIAKLIKGSTALKSLSNELGKSIGRRFTAYYTWEDRIIFKGKSQQAQVGERYILSQSYQEAVTTLSKALEVESDMKEKGRICHNLGYCYEVLGDLQRSKTWLTKGYTEYGNDKSLAYLNTINQRITEEEIIERQRNK